MFRLPVGICHGVDSGQTKFTKDVYFLIFCSSLNLIGQTAGSTLRLRVFVANFHRAISVFKTIDRDS